MEVRGLCHSRIGEKPQTYRRSPRYSLVEECEVNMTAQKLYRILKFLDDLDRNLGLQKALQSVRDALNSLVNSPAAPQYQSVLATALAAFTSSAAKLGESIAPLEAMLIANMGGVEFFDPSIAEKVKASIATNAMTPTVARDFVQGLASRREEFLATVRSTLRGLADLQFTDAKIEPGSAEMAFLIPRDLFDNELGTFAKELTFINSLIRDVSEGRTGEAESVELQELSSSVPTVALAAKGVVVEAIAVIVNKFLEAWKKIEEIREIRERLAKIGMKGTALDELTAQVATTVEEVVEESTTTVLMEYNGDGGRKNELTIALTQDMHRLFGQIERGLAVEFHAEPKQGEQDEANRKALEAVSALSKQMRFPQIANEPLLLTNGEVVEGPVEGVRIFKRTTVRKSIKKETQKQTKPETKEGS